MDSRQSGISVAIITFNEADRLEALFASIYFADEVVVIDSGSTDSTVELAQKLGAKVIHNDWPGFGPQKQLAMESCTGQWILNLDADELVSPQLAEEMVKAVAQAGSDVNGFSMPRLSRYLGRWIRHGGWYPDRKVRLVRQGKGHWTIDGLHEKLEVQHRVDRLNAPLHHHVYRNIADQVLVINRYSDQFAADKSPVSDGYVTMGILHAVGKFLECYLWKLGLLDGKAGLIIAMNSSWYVFLKHAKAWEKSTMERKN